MKSLSFFQANRCEHAKHPKCRCRCGGVLHGKGRDLQDRADFEELPGDDPHRVEPKGPRCPDCGAKGERKGHMTCQYPQDEAKP